jgi:hypothetical protein
VGREISHKFQSLMVLGPLPDLRALNMTAILVLHLSTAA